MAIRWESKRPDEVRDYRNDWSAFLGVDTIATSAITADGVTVDSDTYDDTSITVWLSGGTDGALATITNTITTAAGRVETEVFTLRIRATAEPVSLATARAHLRVLDDNEDALIESYIRAAREWVENYTGHILVRRTIEQPFRNGFSTYFELFHRPVVSVASIGYTDTDGAAQTLADFAVTTGSYPFRVYPDTQPSIRTNSMVTVTYTAGYAEGEEPQALIQAMLLLIGHWHAHRESVVIGETANEVPMAVESLCNQYRVPAV